MPDSYVREAEYYDAIYTAMKDYPAEAERVRSIILGSWPDNNVLRGAWTEATEPVTLLDVACGTGLHASHLSDYFRVTGVDLSESMLKVAKQRVPKADFHVGDMRDFNLGHWRYDVVTCLFSAIGHMPTLEDLQDAVSCMAVHLRAGGVLVVEPWITPEMWDDNRSLHVDLVADSGVARITRSSRSDNKVTLDMHFFVEWPEAPDYFRVVHEVTMFTHQDYLDAFRMSGLSVKYDEHGLMGRGLYIGVKNS